ncbi:MAG: HAD-IB family hydrolase [Ichthyobacteriaceae bacterium]|nr:HAD-IB family hydrolase [Ichthyobacteriaceae bacterium]
MKLALFDFDGTITKKDTLIDFIKYSVGKKAYYFGLAKMFFMLIGFKLKIIPNHKAKEKFIAHFFGGWNISEFQKKATEYSNIEIDKITFPKAIEKLNWHKQQNHKIVVVSASMECWLKPWCVKNNLDLISTQLKVVDGKVLGSFYTKNCHGQEKVNRIKKELNLNNFDEIYAYGDSSGDTEMLEFADKGFYKLFE